MKATVKEYAEALHLAIQESKLEDYDVVVENLVMVLKDNNDLDKYEAVVAQYESLLAGQDQVREVEAIFARQSTANKGLIDELNAVIGPNIQIRSKVDNELVGGVVLRVDDTLIDASVKGGLDRLKEELSE